jgi:hypothetical protein
MIPRHIIRKRLHFRKFLEKSATPVHYFLPKFIGAKLSLPGLFKNKFISQNPGEAPFSTTERQTRIYYRYFNTKSCTTFNIGNAVFPRGL